MYTDPRDGSPIYIGKGKGWRAYSHQNWSTNEQLQRFIKKRQSEGFKMEPEIVAHGTEDNMFLVEVALINFYGRKDHLMGPLLNATDGGEGVSNPSDEVRAIQRASAFRRNGGERIFDFENYETGEIFTGNMPDFADHIGKDHKQVNKLTNSVEVHSIAGWIIKDSGVVPQNYEKKFHFFHAGTEEEFIGTQAELMKKTGLSAGLISMMVHKTIEHANGWVLYEERENTAKLRKSKTDRWYHPRVRWNNPRKTKKSEATWAMALEIKKVWEKLKTEKSGIGGSAVLRSMNLLDHLSLRVADMLCREFREKTFDPETDDEWKAFYQTYLQDNNLPEYVFPNNIVDGRSKAPPNKHNHEIRAQIAKLIDGGVGPNKISSELGISRSAVQRFKKAYSNTQQ
jgi:hypothetical protein